MATVILKNNRDETVGGEFHFENVVVIDNNMFAPAVVTPVALGAVTKLLKVVTDAGVLVGYIEVKTTA